MRRRGCCAASPTLRRARGSFAVLRDEGVRTRERMWPVYAKGIAENSGAYVSDEEAEVLSRALGRVRAAARVD